MEERSGDVLAARQPRASLPIASATKLMTAYLVLRALDPKEPVVAAPYRATPGESLMGLEPGEETRVEDLLYGLLIASGNDAAMTLAIRVAGSAPSFVDRMNSAARSLGLGATRYVDPVGLGAGNVSSAADLVALASELRRQPLFREIVNTRRHRVRLASGPEVLVNRNNLVVEEPFVSGVKTGTTVEAGYILVGSAKKRGVNFLAAVLGAPGEAERDEAGLRLLTYGAELYPRRVIVPEGKRLGVLDLGPDRGLIPLVAGEALEAVARVGQRPRFEVEPPQPTDAPVRRGQVLGSAKVLLAGETVGAVDVVAARAAPAATKTGLNGLPGWAWAGFGVAVVVAAGLAAAAIFVAKRPDR